MYDDDEDFDDDDLCENVVHGGDPNYPEEAPAEHDFLNPIGNFTMRLCGPCYRFLSGPM